jgi:hypothetical protein
VNLPDFERFATTHLACLHAAGEMGQLTTEALWSSPLRTHGRG